MIILKEKIEKLFKRYEFCFGDENYEFKNEIEVKFNFLNILADKINENVTIEKMVFFYTLLSYTFKDDIDFTQKSKKSFLRNFIFEKRGGVIRRKKYDYTSPVSLSLYCPEFYETINEVYEGENVSLPYKLKQKNTEMTPTEKEEMKPFFDVLDEVKKEMVKNIEDNFATIMIIDWLKSGCYATDNGGWFYTAFRKFEVIENDPIYLDYKDEERFDIDGKITANKDMIIWNMLNSRYFLKLKAVDKFIALNDLFFVKIDDFFKNQND